MNNINWKDVLGYESGNNLNRLRTKYKRQSLRRHPNRPGGSTEAMQELGRAWEKAQEHFGMNWRRAAETPEPAGPSAPPRTAAAPRKQERMLVQGKVHEGPSGLSYYTSIKLTVKDRMKYKTLYQQIARTYPAAYYITGTFDGKPTRQHPGKLVNLNEFKKYPPFFHVWKGSAWLQKSEIVYSVQDGSNGNYIFKERDTLNTEHHLSIEFILHKYGSNVGQGQVVTLPVRTSWKDVYARVSREFPGMLIRIRLRRTNTTWHTAQLASWDVPQFILDMLPEFNLYPPVVELFPASAPPDGMYYDPARQQIVDKRNNIRNNRNNKKRKRNNNTNNRIYRHPKTGAAIYASTWRGQILGAMQAGMRCTRACPPGYICSPATMQCYPVTTERGKFLVSLGLRPS